MCASTAPQNTPTEQLENYVNFSNCVAQHEIVEFYILSESGKYGNYDILGKVIELKQSTEGSASGKFRNATSFDAQPVCDIVIRHGWVRSITCDKTGAGYGNNATQFGMFIF